MGNIPFSQLGYFAIYSFYTFLNRTENKREYGCDLRAIFMRKSCECHMLHIADSKFLELHGQFRILDISAMAKVFNVAIKLPS